MTPSICEQLLAEKRCDRLAVISEIADSYYAVSHIIDEHGIIHDVRWAHLRFIPLNGATEWEWTWGQTVGCCPHPWKMRLQRLARERRDHFLAFLWECERIASTADTDDDDAAYAADDAYDAADDAADAADDAAYATAAVYAYDAADDAADAAAAAWGRLARFLTRLEADAFPGGGE